MPVQENRAKQAQNREMTELAAIYDTICETLSSQRADSNIIDVYVLYDFVSALLVHLEPHADSELRPKSRNSATLVTMYALARPRHATMSQQDVLPLFFDYDKLYYDTNAIDAAMTTARCTQKQRAVLWPLILQCILQSQEKSTSAPDAAAHDTQQIRPHRSDEGYV